MNSPHLTNEVLLDITNVLNSKRDTTSFWRAVTEQIKRVIPWERAGITLYDPEIGARRRSYRNKELPFPISWPSRHANDPT